MSAAAPVPATPLDFSRWRYRFGYRNLARWMARYHGMRVTGAPLRGPCIYVTHHGAGYLNVDLALAVYFIAWRDWWEAEGPPPNLRIAAAVGNPLERAIPGLAGIKRDAGLIDPSERSCLQALEAGHQLLITPGGHREASPRSRHYRLRWDNRYGFARLAVRTGLPIVPLATVGGYAAYPGFAIGRLSFWSPLPLPARLDLAIGAPMAVPHDPERWRDPEVVHPVQQRARAATQALYDDLLSRRRRRP
ncbi:MAG: glycerol acyltransferase [Gemmatimonadota bacterium]|nr:glycerol acyltransferase [Gemmatimonadota bacterium]